LELSDESIELARSIFCNAIIRIEIAWFPIGHRVKILFKILVCCLRERLGHRLRLEKAAD